jgi:sirohydrochlorin cobaltochelatase
MTDLLLKRAHETAPSVDPRATTLLIAAHGTDLNENSALAAKRVADRIRGLGKYSAVLNVYMEEPPLISNWRKLTDTPNVIIVPFFIADGLHSYEDIPVLLGIAEERRLSSRRPGKGRRLESHPSEVFRHDPHQIDNRSVFYAPSIGTDPGFADIIIEQARFVPR